MGEICRIGGCWVVDWVNLHDLLFKWRSVVKRFRENMLRVLENLSHEQELKWNRPFKQFCHEFCNFPEGVEVRKGFSSSPSKLTQ